MDLTKLFYTSTHEWASIDGDVCTIGITKFAADQLSDVTYIELPHVGDHVFKGKDFGQIETVKAVSDLYSPLDGEVIACNEKLIEDPAPITQDPHGLGWLIKIRLEPASPDATGATGATGATRVTHLLDYAQYQQQIASEAH